jgi:DNA-binding transcriptional MerR regulator
VYNWAVTVDELARAAATTTRNIRALQTKGVLAPPSLAGRVGTYGPDHLTRLRVVLRLQRRGFSLSAIRELLAAWESGATLEEVLGLPPRRRGADRRRRRSGQPVEFDELLDSLTPWRGPRDGLLPGSIVVNN